MASVSACIAASASEWPFEFLRVRNFDAAERDAISLFEDVEVDSLSGAHVRPLDKQPGRDFLVGHAHIMGRCQLAVCLVACRDPHRHAGKLGHGGIVGETRLAFPDGAAVRGKDLVEDEALRGLHEPHGAAVHRSLDHAIGREFHRVRHGQAWE
jgi:hypothetical protein